ncbi:hypothetical protein VTJ04DRAFT_509 [Mycothermus thermophilus]|uniref:uncharacterized protein n=1 Tax=Humicola insolens TaxID=85995 RepID=UPI00374354C5
MKKSLQIVLANKNHKNTTLWTPRSIHDTKQKDNANETKPDQRQKKKRNQQNQEENNQHANPQSPIPSNAMPGQMTHPMAFPGSQARHTGPKSKTTPRRLLQHNFTRPSLMLASSFMLRPIGPIGYVVRCSLLGVCTPKKHHAPPHPPALLLA